MPSKSPTPHNYADAVIPASCFYSGFFVLQYMQLKNSSESAIELLKQDFCNQYLVALPKWTAFVSTLKAAAPADFNRTCLNQLQTQSGLNEWFSPIDPMVSISQQEICDLHSRLFTSLQQKGIDTVAEYVSFSYIVTLDLFLNANEQEDYENCINFYAVSNSKQYCSDFVQSQPLFTLWSATDKADQCELATDAVATQCAGQLPCDGCGIMMASIYQNYQGALN